MQVTFRNVHAIGDNGILISGGSAAPIDDLVFEHCSFAVSIVGNVSCAKGVPGLLPTGCRDYRPREANAVVYSNTSVLALEGRGSVRCEPNLGCAPH